jgi:hypothetical protein
MANLSESADQTRRAAAPLGPLVPSPLLLIGSAFFLACGGFLLYTLVLEEDYRVDEVQTLLEDIAFIGIPTIIGLALAAIVVRRRRR